MLPAAAGIATATTTSSITITTTSPASQHLRRSCLRTCCSWCCRARPCATASARPHSCALNGAPQQRQPPTPWYWTCQQPRQRCGTSVLQASLCYWRAAAPRTWSAPLAVSGAHMSRPHVALAVGSLRRLQLASYTSVRLELSNGEQQQQQQPHVAALTSLQLHDCLVSWHGSPPASAAAAHQWSVLSPPCARPAAAELQQGAGSSAG